MPRWRDRFGQYGIKVSFWGSGDTLKIVIYFTLKTAPRNELLVWLIITPSGRWVLISGHNIHTYHIYTYRG